MVPNVVPNGVPNGVKATTKVVGLIGGVEQVRSSLSPVIHNAAFQELAMDWVYIPMPVADPPHGPHGIDKNVFKSLATAGMRGVNVTMPFKLEAAAAMDRLEGPAGRIGAVNTVNFAGGALSGSNTDGEGLLRFLQKDVGAEIRGNPVVILGAGGAARAIVAAMADAGASSLTVAGRDEARAEELRELARDTKFDAVALNSKKKRWTKDAAIIINATPLGQKGEPAPLTKREIPSGAIVVDLIYNPPVTPLIEAARAGGAVAHNGLGMLLNQAALSFEIWTGVQPPLEKMSAAAFSVLRKRS
jgi:shikimate dehydrogenase